MQTLFGPRPEKTGLQGFRLGHTQISMLSYTDLQENRNFALTKFIYDTFQ